MRNTLLLVVLAAFVLGAGCSDDDDTSEAGSDDSERPAPAVRFCDAYLDYLAEPTPAHLDVVAESAGSEEVEELAEIIRDDDRTGRVLAADADLEGLARTRCQPEWIAGAQGAGSTPAAAQAFHDAVVAGDRFGARNVASANAIAVFEPWDEIEADEDAGTPAFRLLDDQTFVLVLGPERFAECQVETGVVIACTLVDE